ARSHRPGSSRAMCPLPRLPATRPSWPGSGTAERASRIACPGCGGGGTYEGWPPRPERGLTGGPASSAAGERDDEATAARAGASLDVAADAAGEAAREREAEAGPGRPGRRALAAANAGFEDTLPLVGGDARAVVVDRVADGAVGAVDRDRDRRGAVAAGVVEQRLQDPLGKLAAAVGCAGAGGVGVCAATLGARRMAGGGEERVDGPCQLGGVSVDELE